MIREITREQLIEVAEIAIDNTRGVSPELRERVMHVARTATRIAGQGHWWDEQEQCGCLIGTMNHGEAQRAVEYAVGIAYMNAMSIVTGTHLYQRAQWLDVVDVPAVPDAPPAELQPAEPATI